MKNTKVRFWTISFFVLQMLISCPLAISLDIKKEEVGSASFESNEEKFSRFYNDLRNKNAALSSLGMQEPSIPKTIHFIHLSDDDLSDREMESIRLWIEKNPGYKAQLWSLSDHVGQSLLGVEHRKISDLGFRTLSRAFAVAESSSEREEIVRYEILLQEGGISVDDSTLAAASLEALLTRCDLFCSVDPDKESFHCGSLAVGAAPGHPAIRKMIEQFFSEELSENDVLKEKVASALKKAMEDSVFDKSQRCIAVPSSAFSIDSKNAIMESDDLSCYVFNAKDPHQSDIERLMSTSLAQLKVQSRQFLSHFFALIALSLICVVMLAAIIIKIKQRYFS